MKKLYILFLLFPFTYVSSQDNNDLIKKVKLLYDYEEYGMAITLYDSLLSIYPDSIDFLFKKCNCYLKTEKFSDAKNCYIHCLKDDPDYYNALVQLARVYEITEHTDSSLYYYTQLLNKNIQDPLRKEVYKNISNIYLGSEGMEDSCIYFAQRALFLDRQDPESYFQLAFAYIKDERNEEALKISLEGMEIDSEYPFLLLSAGLGSYYLEDFKIAKKYFEDGWLTKGMEEIFSPYYAQSILLSNTHPAKFYVIDEKLRFSDIKSNSLNNFKEYTRDSASAYFYPTLLRKFNDSALDMTLDDFIMLYIGYTNDVSYSPYSLDKLSKPVYDYWKSEEYDEFLEDAEKLVKRTPIHYPLYYYISEVYRFKGMYQDQLENLFKFHGFSQAVMATGTGKSKEDAIIVAFINHEYEIMNELGIDVTSQMLVQDEYSYDLLEGNNESGDKVTTYFNIDLAFSTLRINNAEKEKSRKFFRRKKQ